MKVKFSSTQYPEQMGVFGFSWPEKVGKLMIQNLKGSQYQKVMKDFWQPMQRNVRLIKNVHSQYMALLASGYKPVNFDIVPDVKGKGGTFNQQSLDLAKIISRKTNVALPIVHEFFRAIFVLARDGKIPVEKWNPVGHAKTTALKQKFATERGFFYTAKKTADYAKILMLLGGLAAGGYFLSQMKGLKNA